jgi:SAM-dependent methyltransferase
MTGRRVKLNLGCGLVRPDGWTNTDSSLNSLLQKFPLGKGLARRLSRTVYDAGNATYMNLNRPWPYGDESVDVVYASHLFEHLTRKHATLFLNEAYRTLKPGGVIRLVVPDLQQLAREYVTRAESGDPEASHEFLYCLNLHRDGQYGDGRRLPVRVVNRLQAFPSQHKYMYDRLSLRARLEAAGFVDLLDGRYGESQHLAGEIQEVENTAEGVPSVYVEGLKRAAR